MKPKLISMKTCPFVQRSVITLREKNVDFDIEYIDLGNKPDWFLKISPLGKVPVLQVGDKVLFESAVINEYLDEVYPPSLHPTDPLDKAQNRSVVEFNSNILMTQYATKLAKTKDAFEEKYQALLAQLNKLEDLLGDNQYLNGDKIHLVDLACAPLLYRALLMEKHFLPEIMKELPRLKAWAERLAVRPSVQNSTVPEFEQLFLESVKKADSYVSKLTA